MQEMVVCENSPVFTFVILNTKTQLYVKYESKLTIPILWFEIIKKIKFIINKKNVFHWFLFYLFLIYNILCPTYRVRKSLYLLLLYSRKQYIYTNI